MNEKLQEQLAEVLKWLLQWAQSTQEFVLAQAPLIVQEAIRFGRASETWDVAAGAVSLAIGLVLVFRSMIPFMSDANEARYVTGHSVLLTIRTFGGIAMSFIGLMAVLTNISPLLKVWFAPRIYLLEWVAQLIKGV